jgi:hypothetical protein
MPYVVIAVDFPVDAFFCEVKGSGFKISTNPKEAQPFDTVKEAETASTDFERSSGMLTMIKKLKKI